VRIYSLGAYKHPHRSETYTPSPSHPQAHESRDKPLSHSVWLLPRHLNQAQQLLHPNVQCRRLPIVASKSCFLEHGHRMSSVRGIVEKLDFRKNVFEGFDVRDRWHTEFRIEVLRESEIGENRVGGGRSDDKETTTLKSGLSYQIPTATILLPLVAYGQRGPEGLVEQSWRTWARSASNLKTCEDSTSKDWKRDIYRAIAPGYPRR
jgi:hypothetical protein